MRSADYLVAATVSFIVLLEATTTEAFVPTWMNVAVSAAACVVAWLLWRDARGVDLRKEE